MTTSALLLVSLLVGQSAGEPQSVLAPRQPSIAPGSTFTSGDRPAAQPGSQAPRGQFPMGQAPVGQSLQPGAPGQSQFGAGGAPPTQPAVGQPAAGQLPASLQQPPQGLLPEQPPSQFQPTTPSQFGTQEDDLAQPSSGFNPTTPNYAEPAPSDQRFAAPRTLDPPESDLRSFEPREPVNTNNGAPPLAPRSVLPASRDVAIDSVRPTLPPAPRLLNAALHPPQQQPLNGRPVTLLEVVSRLRDRSQQLGAIKSYWNLSLRVAEYNLAIEEQLRLNALTAAQEPALAPLLTTAQAAAAARVASGRLNAVAAQEDLIDAAGMGQDEVLPVPEDAPFVGVYRTEYNAMFAGRTAPVGMRRIARTLPLRREALDTAATAAMRGEEAANALTDAYRRGQLDLLTLLNAHVELSQQRRVFLAQVHDYNFDIADFALTSVASDVPPETIVSMLIEVAPRISSVLVPSRTVAPVSATAPIQNAASQQPTLAAPPRASYSSAVQAAPVNEPTLAAPPAQFQPDPQARPAQPMQPLQPIPE